jgi:hypothetical protein
MIRIKAKPGILLRSRLEILHDVVKELSQGFLGDLKAHDSILNVIQKGVLDRQLLQEITFYYLNADDEIDGFVSLEINWKQHQVFASNQAGNKFSVEESKSIRDQISGIYSVLVQHTDELKKTFGTVEVQVHYRYRPEITNNPEKDAEVSSFLGLSKVKGKLRKSSQKLSQSDDSITRLEYYSRNLQELRIKIEHKHHLS